MDLARRRSASDNPARHARDLFAPGREVANALMHTAAGALVETGFAVTDRTVAKDQRKIFGYEVTQRPAGLR